MICIAKVRSGADAFSLSKGPTISTVLIPRAVTAGVPSMSEMSAQSHDIAKQIASHAVWRCVGPSGAHLSADFISDVKTGAVIRGSGRQWTPCRECNGWIVQDGLPERFCAGDSCTPLRR
jgi:hypothetical protein